MAPFSPSPASRLLFFLLLSLPAVPPPLAAATDADDHGPIGAGPKTTQLSLYLHEINRGPDATVIRVAEAPTTEQSPTLFGTVFVADEMMRAGQEAASTLVGRLQGVFVPASRAEVASLAMASLVFVDGRYNGSSLTFLGRNPILAAARELSVAGGSGYFRLASGYALLQTRVVDPSSGVVIVQYNVTVLHY